MRCAISSENCQIITERYHPSTVFRHGSNLLTIIMMTWHIIKQSLSACVCRGRWGDTNLSCSPMVMSWIEASAQVSWSEVYCSHDKDLSHPLLCKLHCKNSMVILTNKSGYLSCTFVLSMLGTEQMHKECAICVPRRD